MSGYIIHDGADIKCFHGSGSATPLQTDARVKVSGQFVMTVMRNYLVTLCTQNTPCAGATWTTGAAHVTASGLSVAISSGLSKCDGAPPGPLKPITYQLRVKAS